MTRLSGKIRQIDPEQLQRRGQFFLVREFEKDARIGRHGQPGVLRQLLLQLARAPAGIAQGNQHAVRAVALADRAAAMQAAYGQERDLLNQLLGQAQAFQAAGNLLQTFGVSKLALVKENKLYQQLSGMKAPNGSELKGTWVEFCGLLGISDDKANEDINNLNAFGEDALEQMQRIGIGYRELRQYRKLPEDQKQALIEVAKAEIGRASCRERVSSPV